MVQPLTCSDIPFVASLHHAELPGFLSKLGPGFLNEFYNTSLAVPTVFTLIYKKDGKVAGFATGATSSRNLLSTFLKKNPIGMGSTLFFALITHPQLMRDIVKTFAYPGFEYNQAELLSISVDQRHQRKGIGSVLFKEVIKEFKKRGISAFKVSIYDGMSANSFYKKMGCQFDSSFSFMGKRMNYYRYVIAKPFARGPLGAQQNEIDHQIR